MIYTTITEREKAILIMRLQNKTLQEVGQAFSVTRERIRNIEDNILNKLIELRIDNDFKEKSPNH